MKEESNRKKMAIISDEGVRNIGGAEHNKVQRKTDNNKNTAISQIFYLAE
jgi:hypothetical protein